MKHPEELLRMEKITKKFPGVTALDKVDFSVNKGEVHALLGENGAGKSTLMKVLIGMYSPTEGKVWFNGKYIKDYNIIDSINMNIAMIHQELNPILHRSVMENIWLGREPKNKLGFIDHNKMYKNTIDLFEKIDIRIKPDLNMSQLSVAQQQLVEIAKAISYNAELIIMDEPTSSLTDNEVDDLFSITNTLRDNNVGVIYISHKLEEIFKLCDRVTILRDGQHIQTCRIDEVDNDKLINLMVGRDLEDMFYKDEYETDIGDTKLKVENLSHEGWFKNVSFDVREGEILGFAGLVGAGRTEVMDTLFGLSPKATGEIFIDGELTNIKNASDAVDNGLAFLTEDRRATGIFPMLSVGYNMVSSSIDYYKNSLGLLNTNAINRDTQEYVDSFAIKTPSSETAIENLSGGNQQKVLIAKWLLTKPEVLILDEPTRGIDVGAKSEIYRNMARMASTGKSIIMVSSELPEVLGMSDRIVVMCEGRVTGILENHEDLTQEEIMRYATGEKDDFSKIDLKEGVS